MGLLDFPHKKGRKRKVKTEEMTEGDKFNNTVKELRVLLNKLSNDNFVKVSKQIVDGYSFTPSMLNEFTVSRLIAIIYVRK